MELHAKAVRLKSFTFVFMVSNNWGLEFFIVFCVVTAIQIFYFWYFFGRFLFYRPKTSTVSKSNPVSIIICARDESQNLLNNLPGILAQDYPYTHELVIVDDNSFDDTAFILEQFQKTYKQINIIRLTENAKFVQGKKFPLSVGIKSSKYEILLLTDADCTPASPNWLESMQHSFNDQIDIVLGYGPYKKQKGLLNKIIRFETFHTAMQYLGFAMAGKPYMGVGRNLSYKKTLFYREKGFSAHNRVPSGDDDLFINKAATKYNTAVNIDPESFVYSNPKTSWGSWRKQKKRHFSTGKYYKWGHRFLLGLYSFSQVMVYPLFVVSLLFFNWIVVLAVFAFRLLSLVIVWFGAMNKLKEKDLKPWFLFFDIFLFFYLVFFSPSLFRKTKSGWN
jgi:glycosyltransferase involved in cell wall biosynthesis